MVGKIKTGACYYDMRRNAFITPIEFGKIRGTVYPHIYRCEVEFLNEGHEVTETKEQYMHEAEFANDSILDTSLYETQRVMTLAKKTTKKGVE